MDYKKMCASLIGVIVALSVAVCLLTGLCLYLAYGIQPKADSINDIEEELEESVFDLPSIEETEMPKNQEDEMENTENVEESDLHIDNNQEYVEESWDKTEENTPQFNPIVGVQGESSKPIESPQEPSTPENNVPDTPVAPTESVDNWPGDEWELPE